MSEEFCQSCGRMISRSEEYGCESDGALNREFCRDCYRNGDFTDPSLTRWQVVSRTIPMWMQKKHLSYRDALIQANYFISSLRRWHTNQMWT